MLDVKKKFSRSHALRTLLYTSFFVGWVEWSETHQTFEIYNNGGFRSRSTHPT